MSLLSGAFVEADFARFDAAVAYATLSGVEVLRSLPASWKDLRKRWLIGIDWCRSEPLALDALAAMDRSKVRIHDGELVVKRANCPPQLPFHTKTFIFRSSDSIAVVSGSGNLSSSGLSRGHESGTLVLVKKPLADHEKGVWRSCRRVSTWFEMMWRAASDLSNVIDRYRYRFEQSDHLKSPTPTEDDSPPPSAGRGLSPEQLKQLRACRFLWIEAGNLHKNRGPGKPGNQLMLSPMTRVFFGFPATNVPTDTLIGHVTLEYAGHRRGDCSLRFSNNSMDVLTLPIPGTEGPPSYDQQALLFEKTVDASGKRFVLELGSPPALQQWMARSSGVGASYNMISGRQWGVF